MRLIYIDDSYDSTASCQIFSALALKEDCWHQAFQKIKAFRSHLKKLHGIPANYEIHAWKFVSGRGRPSNQILTKYRRSIIFKDILGMVAALPGVEIFNACGPRSKQAWIFERLMNRINRTLREWDDYGLIISDQGKEYFFNSLRRKMAVINFIPSRFGRWQDTNTTTKNIPIDRILEDIYFKDSAHCYFIQLADCVAYALLRREKPIPAKTKYGIDKAFTLVAPITVKAANPNDTNGIIRLK